MSVDSTNDKNKLNLRVKYMINNNKNELCLKVEGIKMANISNPQLIKQLLMALARIKRNVVVDETKSYCWLLRAILYSLSF